MHGILTEKLHCNGFLSSQRITMPLFQNSNKDKEFSFNFRHRHENSENSGERQGPPPPPTPWQGLFIMYYWLCMIGLFIILSYGSHFLLILINLDTILAAFIHSFLCDVDFLGNLCCCKKLFPQQPTVISICCFVMSFCI